MSSILNAVGDACERHLIEIEKLFKPGIKITLLIRTPGEPEKDFVLSNDDNLDEIIKVVERTKRRENIKRN